MKKLKRRSYPIELRRKAVKLHLEEGFSLDLIAQEVGAGKNTVHHWVQRYREHGEAGLEPYVPYPGGCKVPKAIRSKIVEVKTQNPSFGVKRISQWIRRVFFLPASPETVRRTLHEKNLLPKTKKKAPRNPPKPRFFERATPNQMWQSDIMMFPLGGKNAYLIGFMDDHSRYMVGLGLFRSQTAEHVLEVYRTAVGEYGVPKEMLTDQGRQYANWRGKTRFQLELQKDRVHHFMSRPHHPMTLGKIERFWKTIHTEFLVRAQFASFEEAQERVRFWTKYYNHKRPHQGLEGMCPADRFFKIQEEMRNVIEKNIQQNVEELALRGPPNDPSYLVGQLGGKSVVLQVEKGQFKMTVEEDKTHDEPGTEKGKENEACGAVDCAGAGEGGAGGVDGVDSGRGVPATESQPEPALPVGEAGHERDAAGAGAAGQLGERADAGGETGTAAGSAEPGAEHAGHEPGQATGEDHATGAGCVQPILDPAELAEAYKAVLEEEARRTCHGHTAECGRESCAGAEAGGTDHPSQERNDHGDRGSAPVGHLTEDLLRVGAPRAGGPDGGVEGCARRTPRHSGGSAEGGAPETGGGA